MEIDLQSLFGSDDLSRDVYSCTHWLRPRTPPPTLGLVQEGAIGQPRQTTSLCNPLYKTEQRNCVKTIEKKGGERLILRQFNILFIEGYFGRCRKQALRWHGLAVFITVHWREGKGIVSSRSGYYLPMVFASIKEGGDLCLDIYCNFVVKTYKTGDHIYKRSIFCVK